MTSSGKSKLLAGMLTAALLLPATTALGNDWSKPQSRTKGEVIGAATGAVVGGPPGAVVGAMVGNGVQYARRQYALRHYAHYRRY